MKRTGSFCGSSQLVTQVVYIHTHQTASSRNSVSSAATGSGAGSRRWDNWVTAKTKTRNTPRPFANSSTSGAWITDDTASRTGSSAAAGTITDSAMSTPRAIATAAMAPHAIAKTTSDGGSGSHRSTIRTAHSTPASGMSARTSPMTDATTPR